jgi:hypothetical protein
LHSKTVCHWLRLNGLKEQQLISGETVRLKVVQFLNILFGKGVDVSEEFMSERMIILIVGRSTLYANEKKQKCFSQPRITESVSCYTTAFCISQASPRAAPGKTSIAVHQWTAKQFWVDRQSFKQKDNIYCLEKVQINKSNVRVYLHFKLNYDVCYTYESYLYIFPIIKLN